MGEVKYTPLKWYPMLSITVCKHTRINASTSVYKFRYIDINAGIVLCTVNSLITLWSGGTIWFPLCALPCQYVCGRIGLSLGPILMLCAFAGSVIERSGALSINNTGSLFASVASCHQSIRSFRTFDQAFVRPENGLGCRTLSQNGPHLGWGRDNLPRYMYTYRNIYIHKYTYVNIHIHIKEYILIHILIFCIFTAPFMQPSLSCSPGGCFSIGLEGCLWKARTHVANAGEFCRWTARNPCM